MTKISRNDIYVRDERGADWFNDFLQSFAKEKPASVQDILNAILNKKTETVESVVQSYREQVGLDIINSAEEDPVTIKQASVNFRPLSLRHASGLGPIAPMKLKKLKAPDDILKDHDDSEIVVQIKLDGFKTQAIKDKGGAIKLYTRRGEDFTSNVPSLVKDLESKMKSGSFVLGELVWEDSKGKQSISDIQTVVGSSPEKAQEKIKSGDGKMIFYVYDLLWLSGSDITKQKYIERYNKLKSLIGKGTDTVKVVDNYSYSDKDKAINDALKVNAEGIVLKPKDSEYKYGAKGSNEPHGEWAKYKPGAKAKVDEVILNKYTKKEDKLVFPMYQYKGNELFEVGKLSGMSKEDEAKLKKDIDADKSVVVEITFQERMPSGKFRHVGWSRFRPDKPVKEVKTSKASLRPLSIRHANEDAESIVERIKKDPELQKAIDSHCEHSGGTKNIHSLIYFLRNLLGKDVSFSDEELKEYLEGRKKHYKENVVPERSSEDVGRVGTDATEEHDDEVADFMRYDGAK